MTSARGASTLTECDLKLFETFMEAVKTTLKAVKEFNSMFTEFIDDQKKIAKDLWDWVTRYNILNA